MNDIMEQAGVAAGPAAAQPAADAASHEGMYLTFVVNEETYGIEILKVQEIIGMMPVTQVPRMPAYVRGVINLRGRVIPVVDLRAKFDMDATDDTGRTCIIVIQVTCGTEEVTMGVIVDEVSDVVHIMASQIEPPPSLGASVNTDFILGMGKVENRVVMLLDTDAVLGSDTGVATAVSSED
jgi:purine-binding chemotaxis protein CheW